MKTPRLQRVAAAFLAAACLAPAATRAAEIWSPNPCVAVFEGPDYSGQDDPKCAIRLAGARGGAFSGQVVVFAKGGAKLAAAKMSDLAQKDGGGVIPASAIEVRYALPTGSERGRRFQGVRNPRRFDALASAPRAEGTTHPVWVTVNVPADAKPGAYEGTLSVAGREVPMLLKVHAWTLPPAKEYTVHVGLVQSPESVALQYGADLWSERHFELIGKSFDQMAKVGNKTVFLPLICQTNFGNAETMVRWVKADDGYAHDYSVAEKYLDLYIERVGPPDVVCFYVWEPFSGGGYFGKKGREPKPIQVSLLDKATGKVSMIDGPIHAQEGSEAFWKPVLDGLRERLKARGLGDENFMIGIAGDSRPNKEVTGMFQKLAPYARWVLHSHGKASKLNGVPVGYLSHVWGVGGVPDPDKGNKYGKKYFYGWKHEFCRTVFPRYGGGGFILDPPLWSNAPLGVYREIAEATIAADLRGFGRVGADFWGVLKDSQGRGRSIVARFPVSNWSQLNLTTATAAVLHPGSEGALSTVRFEMMREGVQEAEAKVFIEKALTDEAKRAKLGADPRAGGAAPARYEETLKERLRVFLKSAPPGKRTPDNKGWEWFAAESGWPERSDALYAAAAEVAKALGE